MSKSVSVVPSSILLAIVESIPLDQTVKATPTVKSFLLSKLHVIRSNRLTIDSARIREERNKVMEAYQKSVGFQKKVTRIEDLERELEKARKDLLSTGLHPCGTLIDIKMRNRAGGAEYEVHTGTEWVEVPKKTYEDVERVSELLKAVTGSVEAFNVYDRLETRMMMAATVGECMAIINAVAGEEVFSIDAAKVGLPTPKAVAALKSASTK